MIHQNCSKRTVLAITLLTVIILGIYYSVITTYVPEKGNSNVLINDKQLNIAYMSLHKSSARKTSISVIMNKSSAKNKTNETQYKHKTVSNDLKIRTTSTKPQSTIKVKTTFSKTTTTKPQSTSKINTTSNKKETLILFYAPKWWEQEILKRYDPFQNCSRRCRWTADTKQYNKADIVTYLVDTLRIKLPQKRPNQIWVLTQYESPSNMRFSGLPLNNKQVLEAARRKFNWTMGYRRDSDFVVTHGRFVPKTSKVNQYQDQLEQLMKTKTKTSTWLNSHCSTVGRREQYGRLLQQHMQLDIYGGCGKTTKDCNPNNRFAEAFGFSHDGFGKCVKSLEKDYKFYMSLENTLCWDYVTEKGLQKYMAYFLVPVVRAYANLSIFHPPGSVVDASKFPNTEGLAKYINSIEGDQYKSFYSWRKHYVLENVYSMWIENVCRMCERSYEPQKYFRVYESIYDWVWKPRDQDACKPVDDLH